MKEMFEYTSLYHSDPACNQTFDAVNTSFDAVNTSITSKQTKQGLYDLPKVYKGPHFRVARICMVALGKWP